MQVDGGDDDDEEDFSSPSDDNEDDDDDDFFPDESSSRGGRSQRQSRKANKVLRFAESESDTDDGCWKPPATTTVNRTNKKRPAPSGSQTKKSILKKDKKAVGIFDPASGII